MISMGISNIICILENMIETAGKIKKGISDETIDSLVPCNLELYKETLSEIKIPKYKNIFLTLYNENKLDESLDIIEEYLQSKPSSQ
ncbi:MAG: hypothetical protein QF917_03045 [Candidatus Woesearchaeota archaeon]|nr:hypothetical protein [Candidatus Woesearchaeota archaeon]